MVRLPRRLNQGLARRPRMDEWLLAIIAGVILLVAYGPSLRRNAGVGAQLGSFNDDARAFVAPMLRYHDPRLLTRDYATDYTLAGLPLLYHAGYRYSAPWVDPRVLSKLLPYLGLAVVLVGVGCTVYRLAGGAATVLAL